MSKISIKIDLSRINKDKIVNRTYTNRDGQEVTAKEYSIDVVPVSKEKQKVIKTGDTWELVKTHFAVETQTKEERQARTKTPILGDGIQFRDLDSEEVTQDVEYPEEDITPDDVPF